MSIPSAPHDADYAAYLPVSHVHDLLPWAPPNAVALTIDDGPDPVWTEQVLDLLHRNGIRATFCVMGIHAQHHPDLIRRIITEGHSVANHSMTHPQPFGSQRPAAILQEIADAQSAIIDAGGVAPTHFRAPCGDWSPAVLAASKSLKLSPLGWSVDPEDWAQPGTEMITARLLEAVPGDILLCHDGGGVRAQTLDSLTVVLPTLKKRGLQFITL